MGFGGRGNSKEPRVGESFVPKRSKEKDTGHFKDWVKTQKKQMPNSEAHNSLRQEMLQLEKRLHDQVVVRHAFEKAPGCRFSSHDITTEVSTPKRAAELIKEIAALELEVAHLEQYLLSLYRKAFGQKISSSPSTKDGKLTSPSTTPRGTYNQVSRSDITTRSENSTIQASCLPLTNTWYECSNIAEEKLVDSSVRRCYSSLSQSSVLPPRASPPAKSLGKALRACHSQPLSMIEYAHKSSSDAISLAEYLGTSIADHVPDTPNKLSEDMIKCMAAIYCKLADLPLTNYGLSSPNSSLSSVVAFSPRDQYDMWSPGIRKDSCFDLQLDNPFHVKGLKELSGPYSTMVEVPCIRRDSQKLGETEDMFQSFRSLIRRLEGADLRRMKHEEKLAFWINIHNALVMHAFFAYGVPQNNVKRIFLLAKAAYNVGGHIVSADTIQNSILKCGMSHPGQWLRLLLSSRAKLKTGDERQAYVIEHREPLLYFALCSGSHSDPAVRVYTPTSVVQELEVAKDEYIRANFGTRKDQKILLPKTVESFAKDSGLSAAGLVEMILLGNFPETVRKSIKKCQAAAGKSHKNNIIDWVPYNFAFRYLISKELLQVN